MPLLQSWDVHLKKFYDKIEIEKGVESTLDFFSENNVDGI